MTRQTRRLVARRAALLSVWVVMLGCAAHRPSLPEPSRTAVAPEPQPLETRVSVGDSFALTVVEERSDRAHRAESEIDLRLEARRPDGWLVSWTVREVRVLAGGEETRDNPFARSFIERTQGMRVEFATNAALSPLRVTNLEEVMAFNTKAAREVRRFASRSLRRREIRAAVIRDLRASFDRLATPEQAESAALDLARVFLLFSFADPTRLPTRFDNHLPDPRGGEPIPAKGEMRLDSWKATSAEATFSVVSNASVAGSDPETPQVLRWAPPKAEPPHTSPWAAGGTGRLPIDLREQTVYVMDLEDGLPRRVHHERRIAAGARVRIETVTLLRR